MKFFVSVGICLGLYLLGTCWVYFDVESHYRWLNFTFWVIGLLSFGAINFIDKNTVKQLLLKVNRLKENPDRIFFGIALFSFIILALFINVYPFHSIGDELRDGALNAQQIVTGEIKQIFAWGRYESHGLIIPTFSALFYLIFGDSIYTFRVPAMLLAWFTVLLVYYFCKKYFSRKIAVFSALTLLAIPAFLYHGRTQVVVMFSSFWMIVLLIMLFRFLSKRTFENFGLLAILLGFASGFHASIRTVVFVMLVLLISYFVWLLLKKKIHWKEFVAFGVIGGLLFTAGFGPRILYTTPYIAFKQERVAKTIVSNEPKTTPQIAGEVYNRYTKSFMGYFYEPVKAHYKSKEPVLPFVLGIVFIGGMIYLILTKKFKENILVIFAFVLPLTNSALTDTINPDNRYGPLFPVAAILVGIGMGALIEYLSKKQNGVLPRMFANVIFIAIIVLRIGWFFIGQDASVSMFRLDEKHYQDFMLTQAVYDLKPYKNSPSFCVYTHSENYDFLKKLHITEQFYYFFPGTKVTIAQDNSLLKTDLRVAINCVESGEVTVKSYCETDNLFVCPPDKKSFRILIED
jgi:4-amino-4-deoxy-L-arabinose transferase-like glycosyltransferase